MFYSEGKEELACGTYEFLKRNLSPREIEVRTRSIPSTPDFSWDEEIRAMVCSMCDFFVDGCDFREGIGVPPCGGYSIIEWLLKTGAENA